MGEQGPSAERLRAIALNRLRALGIPSWVSQGWARGRLVIRPERFRAYAGVRLQPEQDFVVYQHAFLAFPPPSPLQHLGGIRFYEEESSASLLASIERRWASLIAGTEAALMRARTFCPDARLEPESWMIETTVEDRIGRVVFRFDGRLAILYAHAVGEQVLEYGPDTPPIALQLSADPLPIDATVLAPHIREARARVGIAPEREESGLISLDLTSMDLARVRDDGQVVANPSLPGSGDLDIDLDALKTGDIKVYGKEEQAPSPMQPEPPAHARRHPREPQNVAAKLSWERGQIDVVLADVSAGGVFARTSSPEVPARGEAVHLSGFGKLGISGIVAFVRPAEEAALFATGAGVGISFVIEPAIQATFAHQEAPAIAVFLKDWDTRRRAVTAIDEARGVAWTADTLVELAVMLLHLDIELIILDQSIRERADASLGLGDRKIPILAVEPGEPLDPAKVRRRLATSA
jgi:hypothetical protein